MQPASRIARMLPWTLLTLAVLCGCGGRSTGGPNAPPVGAPSRDAGGAALMREHAIDLEVGRDALDAAVDRLLGACAGQPSACTLLGSERAGGDVGTARVQMRLAPPAVAPMLRLAASLGRVVGQRSTAQDVSETLSDVAARMRTLELYRAKLERIQTGTRDVDALIRIASELAKTQSELDALASTQATTLHKTRTELVTVALRVPVPPTRSQALRDALASFGANVESVVAGLVTLCSFLLPLAVLGAAGWAAWRTWRRVRGLARA